MPTERVAMRRVREMLRLSRDAGLGVREVARRTGVAPSTLREMGRRFEGSGLAWPLPLDLTDTELESRLYGATGKKQGHRRVAEPDWAALNRELKRKHVTLQILWDESRSRGAVRRGEALLAGLLRCGHCGRKLHVAYSGEGGGSGRYHCRGAQFNHGGASCISFGGMRVDRAVGDEVIERLQPLGVEAALAALETGRHEAAEKQRQIASHLNRPATKSPARGVSTTPSILTTGSSRPNSSSAGMNDFKS